VHVFGDRRDHFEVIGDVWEMFRVLLDERRRREIDPALAILRQTISELEEHDNDPDAQAKMLEMLDFFETATDLYDQIQRLSTDRLVQIAKKGDLIGKILNLGA
jgi:DNA-binding transcriptional regulator GbsR (MarR family)